VYRIVPFSIGRYSNTDIQIQADRAEKDRNRAETNENYREKPMSNPLKPWQFQPGNRMGSRPIGSRNKLAGEVLDTFLADFRQHGAAALVKVREKRPADYWRIATQLLPNEVLISAMVTTESGSPFADMSPAQKRQIARKLYAQIESEAKVIEAEPSDTVTDGTLPADEVKSKT
jgi:hypothetical protein